MESGGDSQSKRKGSSASEEQEISSLLAEHKKMSRFKVERVSLSELTPVTKDLNRLTPTFIENLPDSSYDSRNSKSLGQLTREVLPRSENYREISANHACRPTLEELHEARFVDKAKSDKWAHRKSILLPRRGKVIKFGWLEGVYMRCILNIWGVMLFLRLSWVIGQAGVVEGIAIICLANIVTLATTLSMSAVSTNGLIEGGGIYYMISRSLGPEFGGAIGLMFTLANSVAVSMYIVGFCESLQDLLRTFGVTIIDNSTNDIRLVGIIALIGIVILAFVGMDWVTRTQMCLLIVLIASQIDFIIGSIIGPKTKLEVAKGFVGYNYEVFKENIVSDYRSYEGVDHDFFSVFAVFFPAVTGIVAGANLSGDLKDPSSAIPRGTLLAILTTFISYLAHAFMMGGCVLRHASGNVTVIESIEESISLQDHLDRLKECNGTCRFGLQNDNQAMELVSLWGPLIYGGCFAATLSSAIASLVGAPRVLQALAKDKLYPLIGYFSKGYGANNDPIRGYLLVFGIAFGCILIAHLNYIAPLLSNFFLAAYALINFSVFHASISKCPGWRPAFKYYNAWVSLVGTLLCIAVMFLISWWTALVTFFVVIALYLYVSYRKPDVNWGSSTQAQSYTSALRSTLELNKVAEHVKNYRPQILVLSGMPGYRPALIDFANLVTKGKSLLVCGQIIKMNERERLSPPAYFNILSIPDVLQGDGVYTKRMHDALFQKAYRWFEQHRVKAFYALAEEGTGGFDGAAYALMRMCGLGKLRPNMILMGYKNNWKTCSKKELENYFDLIHIALDSYLAVGILRMANGLDYSTIIEDKDAVLMSDLQKKEDEAKQKLEQPAGEADSSSRGSTPPGSPLLGEAPCPDETVVTLEEPLKEEEEDVSEMFLGAEGTPLSSHHLNAITYFRRKQNKGFIDVWWLYDDGGLTLLIPHILSTRSQYADCKLRIFSLANRRNELDRAHRNLAALLSKFRIDYSDLIIIPDITRKAKPETLKDFEKLVKQFQEGPDSNNEIFITKNEMELLAEKTNRHMRLRELLLEYSQQSTLVVITLIMPRKATVSAPMYMAWLEFITQGMPPCLIVRGNQTSVLTYYS